MGVEYMADLNHMNTLRELVKKLPMFLRSVDDLMKSVSNTESANRLVSQLRELMKKGGFRLMKWISNDRKVLSEIPESERAKSVVSLDIDDLPTECTLGLK